MRQSDHIFIEEIGAHQAERWARAGKEGLASAQQRGLDIESILVDPTQVREASG